MKNLNNLFNQCIKEVKAIGIEPGNIVAVTVNTRAKTRWGQTKKNGNSYTINISDRILQDEQDDLIAKDTIIHEILHTCTDCMNHGFNWKALANKVNRAYPQYHISRTTSAEEKGIEARKAVDYRYNVICKECGNTWNYDRAGKVVQNTGRFYCPCGGKLTVKCNDNRFVMWSVNT